MIFSFLAAILNAALFNNAVTSANLGLEGQEVPSGRIKQMLLYSSYIAILSIVSFLIAYPLYTYALVPLELGYLDLMLMGFVLIGVNQLAHLVVNRFSLKCFTFANRYTILNSALLFVTLSSFNQTSFMNALGFAFGASVGFVAIMVVYQTIISRLTIAQIPKPFKGLPIILILFGLIATILAGLNGIF